MPRGFSEDPELLVLWVVGSMKGARLDGLTIFPSAFCCVTAGEET